VMKPSSKKITAFQKKILSFYAKHKRDLPWRKTKDPYKILVSEVMLQQTQVDRVIPFFLRWLKNFPTVEDLAKGDSQKVLALWSGLGYNNRALRLQKLARAVLEEHNGKLPQSYEKLTKLPGIGEYTANAILAFAFNKSVPVMDTNIRRVLIHEFNLQEDTSLEELKKIAFACIPKNKSCMWHNALMDYGATIMTAKKTGIKPLSQQGKFAGSDREVRGFVVRELLKVKKLSLTEIKKKFPDKDINAILKKMHDDYLVTVKGNSVMLRKL